MKQFLRAGLAATAFICTPFGAFAQSTSLVQVASATPGTLETIIVTVRDRPEDQQRIPVSLSVVDGDMLNSTSTYNTAQVTQLVPSVNYNSPNPRNTSLTIRGLGSSVIAIAQSNDGLEPGVGFYVDQVYHARPATAAFDFIDVDRVEVLRGPQGTLFGKNTTAGAINIITKNASFDKQIQGEISGGEYGFAQAKGTVTGALSDNVAGRVSVAMTTREGVIHNVTTGEKDNNLGTFDIRGQLLYKITDDLSFRLSTDYSAFVSKCCTQVFYGVGTTLKAAASQYPALAAGKSYVPASLNPYQRKADIDANLKVNTNEGGISGIADWNLGWATVTSVSAWRFWNWDAANDRDYASLSIQTLQHIPSRQDQYSQELRIASSGQQSVDYVAGLYWFTQTIKGEPITQYGPIATYWLLGLPPANPSNLLDGYGTDGHTKFTSSSYAAFGEATWHVLDDVSVTGGLRYTYESRNGSYATTVYGGLQTIDTTLINKQLSILRPQSYTAVVSNGSVSGRANISWNITDDVMAYVSYANGSKSGGINMSGLPLNPTNLPALATAVVKPENNITLEGGFKTELFNHGLLLNIDAYSISEHNFQTNVVDTGPGALRGYLANIEKVRVTGLEMDSQFVLGDHFTGYAASAYTDGRYASYKNGPCPLELIAASTTVCDLSGKQLSGVPRRSISLGGEFNQDTTLLGMPGQVFLRSDTITHTRTMGDPADSKYTVLSGYTLVNASLGFRQKGPWELFFWGKNIFDRNYMQNLTVQAGNSGLIVGTPDDPREVGLTLRAKF